MSDQSDNKEGFGCGCLLMVGLIGMVIGAKYCGDDKKPAKEVKVEINHVQPAETNQYKQMRVDAYKPVSVDEIANNVGLLRVSAVPTESIYIPRNETYVLVFQKDRDSMHALANPADLDGDRCAYDNEAVRNLNHKVNKLMMEGSGKEEIVLFAENITEEGDPYLMLHKVQVGQTIYDMMRCQE